MNDYSNLIILPFYLLAVFMCGAAAVASFRRRIATQDSRDFKIWLLFVFVFALFIALKTTFIVEFLTNAARQEAKDSGWYEKRHKYQVAFVSVAAALWLAQLLYFSRYIAQHWRRYRWPLMGTGSILCFMAIRAVSLHEIDALGIWLTVAKVVVESLAAVLTAWGAGRWMRLVRGLKAKCV